MLPYLANAAPPVSDSVCSHALSGGWTLNLLRFDLFAASPWGTPGTGDIPSTAARHPRDDGDFELWPFVPMPSPESTAWSAMASAASPSRRRRITGNEEEA